MSEIEVATHTLDVRAANGVPFRVVLLADGKSPNFPANDKYNKRDAPLVEFYDRRHPHTPDGQFVSRYYLDTLMDDAGSPVGLDLYGGVEAWTVDGKTMMFVRAWLALPHGS